MYRGQGKVRFSFPETGINSEADAELWKNIQYISSKLALFIRAMIDSGEYDECDYGMVDYSKAVR